jgi:carboxypeptidase Taq
MPRNGAEFRGQQLATLSTLAHELLTQPALAQLTAELAEDSSLTADQKLNVTITLKDLNRKKKYPKSFVEEHSLVTSHAFGAWQEARSKRDFKIFQPHLEKIVELKRREAELLGYEEHPYNALVEDYEPGLTVKKIDEVFEQVKTELFPFIQSIIAAPKPKNDFLVRHYPKAKQWAFAEKVIRKMGYDFDSGRADDAPHPFCTTFGPGDVRITIRSDEHEFNMMLFAAIHEAGHALYEMGLPMKEHYGLPLGNALSLAFHESQSRFWENNIGRSKSFWRGQYASVQSEFQENLGSVHLDEFYRGINTVEPTFIRVEADELTYHAHIYIRYLVEKALVGGEIEVKDLPSYWNDRYEEYLGIRPSHDSEGCLQDVHWAYGSFGYFPTYSFGSFYAAQLHATLKKQIPGLHDSIEQGEFQPILNWLKQNVHAQGRRYTSEQLLQSLTGSGLQVKYFMDYAKEKYSEIYRF